MPTQHLNFKQIREQADFERILSHYGIKLQRDGLKEGQFKGLCPFHDDHSPSMKVNINKNIFHCFACEAGGNVLEFVMKMEGSDLRGAARKIIGLSGVPVESKPKQRPKTKDRLNGLNKRKKPNPLEKTKATSKKKDNARVEVKSAVKDRLKNPALTFELKNLVTDHPFLESRNITSEMIKIFGLGIASRGIMKGRLVFPIHNSDGELVAYCGRFVETDRPKGEPKYKHPAKFKKELEWFNWHRAIARLQETGKPLIVVESFLSAIKLHIWGFAVVSPMGRSVSDVQMGLLKNADIKSLCLLMDGDDPGRAAVIEIGRQLLSAGLSVSAPVVPDHFKPHRMDAERLRKLLAL